MEIVIDIPNKVYSHVIDVENRLLTPDEEIVLRDSVVNGTPLPKWQQPCEDCISNYIKQKIDYLEDLASIETNEGRWREEEKYLYVISVLEEIVEYINTSGGGEDETETETLEGRWEKEESILGWDGCSYQCSNCGRSIHLDTVMEDLSDYPYCHCGAEMSGGGDDAISN